MQLQILKYYAIINSQRPFLKEIILLKKPVVVSKKRHKIWSYIPLKNSNIN